MKRFAIAVLMLAALFLGGCVTSNAAIVTTHTTDCDRNELVGGWNECTRNAATATWLYAQLSSNAYDDGDAFLLPGNVVLRHMEGNDGRGYAYAIYDVFNGQEIVETIIAYRGTESSLDDWLLGNILGLQNGRAWQTARSVASELGDARLTVVGHSLGGALAHHVSTNELELEDSEPAGITSRVFNNSPRFNGYALPADRRAVAEIGDPLAILRLFGTEPDQLYNSLNCQPGLDPRENHSIRLLAECLTWIAAFDDERARRSYAANTRIDRPAGHASEEVPPVDPNPGRRVSVNPWVDDDALARAIQARLDASRVLAAAYCTADDQPCLQTGLRLRVTGDPANGTVNARWIISGVDQIDWEEREIVCDAEDLASCADVIVELGEGRLGQPHVTRRDPRDLPS